MLTQFWYLNLVCCNYRKGTSCCSRASRSDRQWVLIQLRVFKLPTPSEFWLNLTISHCARCTLIEVLIIGPHYLQILYTSLLRMNAWRVVLRATPYVIRFSWAAYCTWGLTLSNLTSVCIFSMLLSMHFLRCWRRIYIKIFFSCWSFPLFSWPY